MVNRITTLFEFDQKGGGLAKIRREVKDADTQVGKFKASVKGAAAELRNNRAAQAGLFAAAATGAVKAISAASDLEESVNAVNVTFGEAADGVLKLSDSAARGVGLASAEFNGLAVQFSAFAKEVAGPGGNVVAVIDDLTKRAADFASVMNLDVNEAARIFQSTLAGETEPIRKFGKDISAAAVELYALENGLIASKSELTESIKVQARYGLLMESTSDAAGDFANTSDSLANRQRILKAELTNLAAELGESLVPAAEAAATAVGGFIDVVRTFKVPQAFALLNTALEGIVGNADGARSALAGFDTAPDTSSAVSRLNDLLDVAREIRNEDNFFERIGRSFLEFGPGIDEGAERFRRLREALSRLAEIDPMGAKQVAEDLFVLRDAADAGSEGAKRIADEWGITSERLAAGLIEIDPSAVAFSYEDLTSVLMGLPPVVNDTADAAASADKAMLGFAASSMKGAEASEESTDATDAQREAIAKLFAEVDRNLSTMFDYENAIFRLEDQFANLDDEVTQLDQNQLARDALSASQAFAEQQGAVEGTTASYVLQRDELMRLQDQFPLLRDEIQRYIDELNRIPAVRATQIVVGYSGAGVLRSSGSSQSIGNVSTTGMQALDDGGFVQGPRGAPVPILAHGGEYVFPSHKQPLSGLMTGMGGGDVVINMTVNTNARDGYGFANEFASSVRTMGQGQFRRILGIS